MAADPGAEPPPGQVRIRNGNGPAKAPNTVFGAAYGVAAPGAIHEHFYGHWWPCTTGLDPYTFTPEIQPWCTRFGLDANQWIWMNAFPMPSTSMQRDAPHARGDVVTAGNHTFTVGWAPRSGRSATTTTTTFRAAVPTATITATSEPPPESPDRLVAASIRVTTPSGPATGSVTLQDAEWVVDADCADDAPGAYHERCLNNGEATIAFEPNPYATNWHVVRYSGSESIPPAEALFRASGSLPAPASGSLPAYFSTYSQDATVAGMDLALHYCLSLPWRCSGSWLDNLDDRYQWGVPDAIPGRWLPWAEQVLRDMEDQGLLRRTRISEDGSFPALVEWFTGYEHTFVTVIGSRGDLAVVITTYDTTTREDVETVLGLISGASRFSGV